MTATTVLQVKLLVISPPASPPPAPKCTSTSTRGTRLATIDGVAEANARFAERNLGGLSV
jgi:hypothetical protein